MIGTLVQNRIVLTISLTASHAVGVPHSTPNRSVHGVCSVPSILLPPTCASHSSFSRTPEITYILA